MIQKIRDKFEKIANIRLYVAIAILLLMLSDFYSLTSLFDPAESDMDWITQYVICFILAVALEGFPTFLGYALSLEKNESGYRTYESAISKMARFVCIVGTLLAFACSILLRLFVVYDHGWFDAVKSHTYNGVIQIDLFLAVYPVLTSLLAFVASGLFLYPDNEKIMEKKVDRLGEKYLRIQIAFKDAYQELEHSRNALWKSLTKDIPRPKQMEQFRTKGMEIIRNRLVEDSIIEYPKQIDRYNLAVETALRDYIRQMSSHSTIPDSILKIDFEQLLNDYDDRKLIDDPTNMWNYNVIVLKDDEEVQIVKDDLETEFKRRINNATVVAQVKTSTSKYPLEGANQL